MHEVSLMRSLLGQVQRIVAEHGGGGVRMLRLHCGELSGIEPELLKSAFEMLQAEFEFDEAAIEIQVVPLSAYCRDCGSHFKPEQFRFLCPNCGSGETDVMQGDALILENIELEPATVGGVA